MTRIAVVDHGAGNLVSISQGLRRAGAEVTPATSPAELAGVDGIVLPGVGATGAAMRRLEAAGLTEPLQSWQGPLLGICVGMQLLFDASEENGNGPCLGLLRGVVRRLDEAPLLPHIGWNVVAPTGDPLFAGLGSQPEMYFVHTYAPVPDDPGVVSATTTYGLPFASAVRAGTLSGVQFHPERSGAAGLRVLANFVAECAEAAHAA